MDEKLQQTKSLVKKETKFNNIDLSALDKLSPAEKELAFSILNEYSKSGKSDTFNELRYEGYKEVPVDIITFVDDYRYLGNAWHDSEGKSKLYPYWRKELVKLFPDNITTSVNNVILSGSRGRGKAQPLDSLVFTENGYVKMGDIQVGDNVYGDDGKLHKVLGVFPQGKKKIYEITFSDHSKVKCSDEHLWFVRDNNDMKWKTLELKEMLSFNTSYDIPITEKLENVNGLIEDINVRTSYIKNIINKYGYFDINDKYIKCKNINLDIDKFIFSVLTLGGIAFIDIENNVCLRLPEDIDIFTNDSEAKKYKENYISPNRSINKIDYIGYEECKCIYIDSDSHLYLTDNLIVTHNTEIAMLIAAYLLHRVLCLENPVSYYHLKATEKLVFAFMNIKLALAEEIGVAKFQNTIQSSPWFLERGTLEGRTKKVWVPNKINDQEVIDIKIGSRSDDLIGLPIFFCLDGDTEILTDHGVFKIKDLEDKKVIVPSVSDHFKVESSAECFVKKTASYKTEYEIELEDGSIIKCTPNHKFRLSDGSYKEAKDLTLEDDLMDIEPYGYIYKTVNNINNKIYIGQHKSSIFDPNYIGSGYMLKKAIKKYGKGNFTTSIIEFCFDKDTLNMREKYFIDKFQSTNKSIGYNIADGGQGGDLGKLVREKISNSTRGKPKSLEQRKKLSNFNKGKKLSEDVKRKISESNKGKKISEETRKKMSEGAIKLDRSNRKPSVKGKICINNGTISRYISKDLEIPEGWMKGNILSRKKHDMSNYYSDIDMRQRKSEAHKGSHNSMYKKGYLRCGGNNTNAKKCYIYRNIYFGCRKDLVDYLKINGFPSISVQTLIRIENDNYGDIILKRFSKVIDDLKWGFKDENKKY